MSIINCRAIHLDMLTELYDSVTLYLEQHINYPKWTHGIYPGRESIRRAIYDGVQYACIESGRAVGAFILNDNPQGDYSKGNWRSNLAEGEYLIIHTLATAPDLCHGGIGKRMVNYCINYAKKSGYKALRLDVVPDNIPARRLYEKSGFLFAGEKDLARGIEEIPVFALYELNFYKTDK